KNTILKIEDLVVEDSRKIETVKGLHLDVKAGEIVGIAGIDGNGQTELIEAITGLTKSESGSIKLNDREIINLPPRKVTESGLGHIPQDRHKYGLVVDMSIGENIVLKTYYQQPYSKVTVLNYKEIYKHVDELVQEYDVSTPNNDTKARSLSGGNQQKAIIGRDVDRSPDLLIAAQPTRGLDVGAIEFIHNRLIGERDKGRAVLLISFELDEILDVSD